MSDILGIFGYLAAEFGLMALIALLVVLGIGLLIPIAFFVALTDPDQIPARIARRLASQGKYVEAARWHVEALLTKPDKKATANFLNGHGGALPSDLCNLLKDLVWSFAFNDWKAERITDMARDSPPLIDLAHKLVVAAHSPKEPQKLKKLEDCARLCEERAPKLAAALRSEPVLSYVLPPVFSETPWKSDRPPSPNPRSSVGECCLCGIAGPSRGYDLYAQVNFWFKTSGGTNEFFHRYAARWEVLFCSTCIPQGAIDDFRRRARLKTLKSVAFLAASAAALVFVLNVNSHFWLDLLFFGLVWLALMRLSLAGLSSRTKCEATFFKDRVERFAKESKYKLLLGLDLSQHVLHWSGRRNEPNPERDLRFVVEPAYSDKPADWKLDDERLKWGGP